MDNSRITCTIIIIDYKFHTVLPVIWASQDVIMIIVNAKVDLAILESIIFSK